MIIKEYNILSHNQKEQVIKLWNSEYPEKLQLKDINAFDNYLSNLEDINHSLIINEDDEILGWFVDFIRDSERWFAMIINDSTQGQGLGSKLLSQAKKRNDTLNGWVIADDKELKPDGSNYISSLGFYMKNEFNGFHTTVLEKKGIKGVKVNWQKSK